MIVLHSLRVVYVGPPKTGSTTLHKWFRQPLLFTPGLDVDTSEVGGQHDLVVPPEATDYFAIMSCRNELHRLDALWRHFQSERDRGERTGGPSSFAEFLDWRSDAGTPMFFRLGPDEFARTRVDHFVRLEAMLDDLQQLPLPAALVRKLEPPGHKNRNRLHPRKEI